MSKNMVVEGQSGKIKLTNQSLLNLQTSEPFLKKGNS